MSDLVAVVRRYCLQSREGKSSFPVSPHCSIEGEKQGDRNTGSSQMPERHHPLVVWNSVCLLSLELRYQCPVLKQFLLIERRCPEFCLIFLSQCRIRLGLFMQRILGTILYKLEICGRAGQPIISLDLARSAASVELMLPQPR